MGSRIAVITPYYRESVEMLWQCHHSVLDQNVEAVHFMIADGFARSEIDDWAVQHVKLPTAHADNGNTPRGLGSMLAKAEGYEFIAYLDADNWFHPGHLASLLALHAQTASPICSSLRSFHNLAGVRMPVSEPDEDALQHVDTSCYLLHKSSFDLVTGWLDMPRILSPLCDRVFLGAILAKGRTIRSTGQRSVAFRTQYACHYRNAGLPVPDNAKEADFADAAWAFLRGQQAAAQSLANTGKTLPGSLLAKP